MLFGYLGVVLGRFLVLLGVLGSKVLLEGVWGLVLVGANGPPMAPGRPPEGFWAFFWGGWGALGWPWGDRCPPSETSFGKQVALQNH